MVSNPDALVVRSEMAKEERLQDSELHGLDGNADMARVLGNHIFDSLPRPEFTWTDVSSTFGTWCEELQAGELLSPSCFTLYDAMSAIELMDPKMDIGLLLKNRKIRSFEDGVKSGMLKLDGFSSSDYLAVMDRSLPCFILWMQGHCVAQTVFTLLYLHKPQEIRDELMRTYCLTLLELIDCVRQIMMDGGVIEEEDFQLVSTFHMPIFEESSSVKTAALLKNLKSAEETANRNARKAKGLSTNSDEESARWVAVALRFKLCRSLVHFFTSFRNRSDGFFTDAPQLLELLQGTLEKITTGYFPDVDALQQAVGFEPLINLHLLPPSFPRHTPLTPDEGTFVFLQNMISQFRVVLLVRDHLKTMEGLMFFLRTEGTVLTLSLSRSMMQIILYHSFTVKPVSSASSSSWHVNTLLDFIIESIRIFSNAPSLMVNLPPLEEHTVIQEYVRTFLGSCVVIFSSLLRIYGLNKARQRDALATTLVDIFSLQDDAEKLDDFLNTQLGEMKLSGFNHSFCFGSWTLTAMLNAMMDYLLSGFELELYADNELHFIYWYLYDVLYHCEVQTIMRADTTCRQNDAALISFQEIEARSSRKNGKKKPHLRYKQNSDPAIQRPHRKCLTRAQTMHHMCGAFQSVLLGLQWQDQIKSPEDSLDCEEFRYYHRLMPFMERNAPAFVDYEHYHVVKSVIATSRLSPSSPESVADTNNIHDIYTKASQGFQQAEHFLSYWAKDDEKARITKVCRRNDIIVKILATGRVCKVEMKFDIHPWFPSLKIL